MNKPSTIGVVITCMLLLSGFFTVAVSHAAGQKQSSKEVQVEVQKQEQIYGSNIMSEQERVEYRARLNEAETAEEQKRVRMEHRKRMEQRAEKYGISLSGESSVQDQGAKSMESFGKGGSSSSSGIGGSTSSGKGSKKGGKR